MSAKPTRRQFTAAYKLKVVREADKCKQVGEVGALLRREGLYSSQLTQWRKARDRGELTSPKKRGRQARVIDPSARRVAELERQVQKLRARAERAEALVDLQKKVAALLGRPQEGEDK